MDAEFGSTIGGGGRAVRLIAEDWAAVPVKLSLKMRAAILSADYDTPPEELWASLLRAAEEGW